MTVKKSAAEAVEPTADEMPGPPAVEARLAAFADELERGDHRAVPGTLDGVLLRRGRPATAAAGRGKSPVRTVRLPRDLDDRLAEYADEAASTPSEVLRQAVIEYMDRHPLGA